MPFFNKLILYLKKRKYLLTFAGGGFFGIIIFLIIFSTSQLFSDKLLNSGNSNTKKTKAALVKQVEAAEIYKEFVCPCCGKVLDPNNICCGSAQERIDYIKTLTSQSLSKDEIILAYVKKYGLNSFKDSDEMAAFKEKMAAAAPADRSKITTNPTSFDFGDVSQKKGIVNTLFEIKNDGNKDLVINKLETSCGCTTASIIYQSQESPKFGMPGHGLNENIQGWQVTIPAGETAQLKVYYDPNVHKDLRGPATREISIFSNDPVNIEQKVVIDLNQVD